MELCFFAQPVTYGSHLPVICFGASVFQSVDKGYRVYYKMIMIMSGVKVSGNNDLESVAP